MAQYSYGHGADEGCGKLPGDLGDPFMIFIPPVVQYLYKYVVVPVDAIAANFTFKYLVVSVYVDYFQLKIHLVLQEECNLNQFLVSLPTSITCLAFAN